jgi:hypothetical protein
MGSSNPCMIFSSLISVKTTRIREDLFSRRTTPNSLSPPTKAIERNNNILCRYRKCWRRQIQKRNPIQGREWQGSSLLVSLTVNTFLKNTTCSETTQRFWNIVKPRNAARIVPRATEKRAGSLQELFDKFVVRKNNTGPRTRTKIYVLPSDSVPCTYVEYVLPKLLYRYFLAS